MPRDLRKMEFQFYYRFGLSLMPRRCHQGFEVNDFCNFTWSRNLDIFIPRVAVLKKLTPTPAVQFNRSNLKPTMQRHIVMQARCNYDTSFPDSSCLLIVVRDAL